MYSQAYGQQLAGARDQDNRVNSQNTGIINQFNQANTNARNATNASNVDQRNGAFKYNEGLKDKTYSNQMRRVDGMSGLNNRDAEIDMAESAQQQAKRRALGNLAGAGLGAAVGGATGAKVGLAMGSAL